MGHGSVSNLGIRSGVDGGADGKTFVVLVGVDAERRAHRTGVAYPGHPAVSRLRGGRMADD